MADSSEPAFLFLYRKGAVAPVDYLSTFATAPFPLKCTTFNGVNFSGCKIGIVLMGVQTRIPIPLHLANV